MKSVCLLAVGLALAGCTATPRPSGGVTVPTYDDYLLPTRPNTAPRGSAEYCRNYGQQTATNRLRSSRNSRGGGPAGFDFYRAKDAGERAAARCRAGRLN